jgi:uncharacterized membrane protein
MTFDMPNWWPYAAAVFILAALVLGWHYLHTDLPRITRKARAALWALRVAIGMLVLLLTLDWRSETIRQETEKPLVQILVDQSLSMATPDAPGQRTRFAAARDSIDTSIQPAWNDPARLRIGLAGETYRDGAPQTATPDASRSAIGRSLREVLENHCNHAIGAVILLTDGAASDEDELQLTTRQYREARVPIYPWIIGTEEQPPDIRILSARLHQPSPSRPDLRLNLTLDSPGFSGKSTTLTISLEGQPLHQQTLTLQGSPQSLALDFISPHRGLHFYQIEITPLESEATPANNLATAAAELRREPVRVIYMEGSVPAETAFLRDGLQADPEMEVTSLHFPGADSLEALAREALSVRGKDMRIFRDGQGREVPSVCHPTRGYPPTLNELLKYDVVIFSDIIKEAYSPEQLDATVAFVEEFGGGFVMVGGITSFGAGDYEKTVIDKLMPIEVANRSDPLYARISPALTETGWQHPIMQVGATEAETRNAWTRDFPGLQGLNYVPRAKPGAYVLARTTARTSRGADLVLLAVQQIGRGRTMAFTSDTTSSWGTEFQSIWGTDGGKNNDYYRQFWNNTIRWLAADRIARKGGQLAIETSSAQAAPGETIRIDIPAESPTSLAGLALTATQPGGSPANLPLQWNGSQRRWEAIVPAATEGEIALQATCRNLEGGEITRLAGIHIRPDVNETIAVATREPLMRELATETRGQIINATNAHAIFSDIAARSIPVTWKRTIPVWDRWWILLPLLFLITGEWLIRKQVFPVSNDLLHQPDPD